jgi:hypothetical protein
VSFDLRVLCQSEKNTGFLFSRFHLRVETPLSESQGSVVPFPDPRCSSILISPFGPLPNYPENAVVYVAKRCLCHTVRMHQSAIVSLSSFALSSFQWFFNFSCKERPLGRQRSFEPGILHPVSDPLQVGICFFQCPNLTLPWAPLTTRLPDIGGNMRFPRSAWGICVRLGACFRPESFELRDRDRTTRITRFHCHFGSSVSAIFTCYA